MKSIFNRAIESTETIITQDMGGDEVGAIKRDGGDVLEIITHDEGNRRRPTNPGYL